MLPQNNDTWGEYSNSVPASPGGHSRPYGNEGQASADDRLYVPLIEHGWFTVVQAPVETDQVSHPVSVARRHATA
jgi:hypothetical protein